MLALLIIEDEKRMRYNDTATDLRFRSQSSLVCISHAGDQRLVQNFDYGFSAEVSLDGGPDVSHMKYRLFLYLLRIPSTTS